MSTTVAITGGIACGKSHCLNRIQNTVKDSVFFSCDAAVSNLLTERDIIRSLEHCVGEGVLGSDGEIDRSFLRKKIFNDPEKRKSVEGIIHPVVLERAEAFLKHSESKTLALLEVPLLYEVDFAVTRDFELVIGCSKETQLARLTNNRGIGKDQAIQMLDAQLPVQQKLDRADLVVWNDGSLGTFEDQIEIILETILSNNIGDDRRD